MAGFASALGERGLRRGIGLFFLLLAVPALLLAYRAYEQTQWEVFHRFRVQAEDLSIRIDTDLRAIVAAEDARSFDDYTYLAASTGVPRSPLSTLTQHSALPGVVGYFQVDSEGTFSTPLLPRSTDADNNPLPARDHAERAAISERMRSILAGASYIAHGRRVSATELVAEEAHTQLQRSPAAVDGAQISEPREAANVFERLSSAPPARQRRQQASSYGNVADLKLDQRLEQKSLAQAYDQPALAARLPASKRESRKEHSAVLETEGRAEVDAYIAAEDRFEADSSRTDDAQAGRLGAKDKLAKMAPAGFASLDVDAIAKSVVGTAVDSKVMSDEMSTAMMGELSDSPINEDSQPLELKESAAFSSASPAPPTAATNTPLPTTSPRVRLFESELDPMTLQALDEQHFVLFRNVWRAGSRYIQGALIEREAFRDAVVTQVWAGTAVSRMSSLLIAWQGEVVALEGTTTQNYAPRAEALRGELLYRTRLSAPLAELELVYSVTRLPLAASVGYLGWVTLTLVIVLAGGCFAMYRFGVGQMRLFRQQQDFVSAVSHELKTPLTSIRMYSEMLKAGWADEARKHTYYTFIHDESERLSRLINNVLQLARMNHGQTTLELTTMSVAALFEHIEGKVASQLAQAGFDMHCELTTEVGELHVAVDSDAVTQIVINLVDNAIKFAPDNAERTIDFTCERAGDNRIRISIRDYGGGVPKAQMRRIFELFYRAESELTRETVGTGIGLALVQQLASAMHGSVDVSNREPGAEFSLTLPLAEH